MLDIGRRGVGMKSFLARLFETGEVQLPREVADDRGDGVARLLEESERVWRRGVAGEPPRFDVATATAASRVLISMCQAVVYRENEIDDLKQRLVESRLPCGDVVVQDPSLHYSVDLLFRFIPQVLERAKRISPSDDLIPLTLNVLRPWPLSSIGVSELNPAALCPSLRVIQADRSLWRMYVDRVISLNDAARLQHPETRAAVAAAIGPFDSLAPEMSRRLKV